METGNSDIKTLSALVKHPESLSSEHRDWLIRLSSQYPYFSIPQLFLSKLYQTDDPSSYKKKLGRAAIQIGDRSELYHMMLRKKLEEHVDQFEEELKEIQTEELEGIAESQSEHDAAQSVVIDALEKEIIYEAISSTIEKEAQEDVGVELEESDLKIEAEEPHEIDSFAAWVFKRSKEIDWEGSSNVAPTDEFKIKTELKKSATELIDDFIAKDPKITPKKSDQFSTENLAKESLIDNEQFISESLAKVYAQQGKLEKARKAYKLLSLKYPEKSIYFAAQIKKLGKK